MEETALMICNMAYKLEKGLASGKKGFYQNVTTNPILFDKPVEQMKQENQELKLETNLEEEPNQNQEEYIQTTDKDYVNVIKKVKKENITPDNIGEIMLCQIPGISSVTALAIMNKFNTFTELIKQVEANEECLKDLSYTNSKGQTRKINKTSTANIVKYLLKKSGFSSSFL
jgi:ERCC4-type nuclease